MRNYLLLLATVFIVTKSFSQNTIGIPDIVNYTKNIYNAGTQNRCITQDKNEIMYFANYEGLLSFDGSYWKIYPLPNKMAIRSIAIGSDNKIYAGSQADIGYFSPATNGKLIYTSLKYLLPEKTIITGFWETIAFGNDIFFRSRDHIIRFANNTITVYPAINAWQFLGKANNRLFAQDSKTGLLEFKKGIWQPFIREHSFPGGFLVTTMFPFGEDSTFVTTVNSGFFILSGNEISRFEFKKTNPFKNQRILTATPISKDWLAVGTNLQGCYIIDKKGDIIQNLSRKEGLQLNNILYLFVDSHKNLWLGLDNGIDFIAINNEIKHIYPENLNEGEGYTSLVFQNMLYVGTSNGVYQLPLTREKDISFVKGTFEAIPNTAGSSFGLTEVNDKLLLGHHDGFFKILNGNAVPISANSETYWTFLPLDNHYPSSLIVAGTAKGLSFLKYEHNGFIVKSNLPGFIQSSQFVEIDNKNFIWVADPQRGVFKIDISDTGNPVSKIYTDVNGLPSSYNNHLFKIKNRVVVATINGVYEYNASTDKFEFSEIFKNNFGHRNIRHLKEDSTGNIWFIENKNLGVVDYSFQQPEIIYFPELDGKMVAGFEHIYPYDSKNIFVGAEKGFYHINYENYKKINNSNIEVKINTVKAFGKSDSLLFGGYFGQVNELMAQVTGTIPRISSNWNSLHFEFSSPLYEHYNSVEFSYLLQGYDEKWSEWSKKTEKDYTNLSGGNYTFQVKAKTNLGKESKITSYIVNVLPPWYKSTIAYFFYAILFVVFNYLFYTRLKKIFLNQKKKHEEQQRNLQIKHQLELEKSEKEIIALKNEKLQSELQVKNTELASVAMHLVQKGDVLSKVKEELNRLKKTPNGEIGTDNFKKLIRVIKDEDNMDEEWQQFATHFDSVHLDFLKSLKKSYPALTPSELKLCAYLQMNLGSKDIAKHLKISVRGVSTSRYRLRKKMKVPNKTNLFDFLLEFPSNHT
ncbi:MAG: triple tyrosine motif-containing protein [Ferruginibacter sp.]